MALKRGAAIPQTPAAASTETPDKKPEPAAQTTLQDRSQPATEAAPAPPPIETPATPEPTAQELATTSAPLPAIPAGGGMVPVADDDDGFGSLDNKVGFGSFPIVKLDKEDFFLGDKKYGKEFYCVILGVKPKILYKEAGKQDTEYLFYTYDNVKDVSNRSVQAQLREWETKGIKWETKEYMECVAREQIPVDKELSDFNDGKVVLLNVAPASVARLAGYRLEVKPRGGMARVITRCIAGDMVTVGKTTFYPWNFEYVGDYAQG